MILLTKLGGENYVNVKQLGQYIWDREREFSLAKRISHAEVMSCLHTALSFHLSCYVTATQLMEVSLGISLSKQSPYQVNKRFKPTCHRSK